MHKHSEETSSQFRVLYRQFLLKIVDLEALSVDADVVSFIGQVAGVLIMVSLIHAFIAYVSLSDPQSVQEQMAFNWHFEQYLVKSVMLVIGLYSVLSWDSAFPDRRDVLILGPLPLKSGTLLAAKVAALLVPAFVALVSLNLVPSFAWAFVLGMPRGGWPAVLSTFGAYWFTVGAAGGFLLFLVLSIEGLGSMLLPRRLFLLFSSGAQLCAFGMLIAGYFLLPVIATPAEMADPKNHAFLAWSPSFWFFALFNQLIGSLPPEFSWVARRGWIGIGSVGVSGATTLFLSYARTMRKTLEEPDLLPRKSNARKRLGRMGVHSAIRMFILRTLFRSRQHRVVFAFYVGLGFAIALACVELPGNKAEWLNPALRAIEPRFLLSTIVMMTFLVVGLRRVFALPISLNANWVLRLTQLFPAAKYFRATRFTLFLMGVVPVLGCSAVLSQFFQRPKEATLHLLILTLYGAILVDLNLINFAKIPFACSYLPGKSNFQMVFWMYLLIFVPVAIACAQFEQRAIHDRVHFTWLLAAMCLVWFGICLLQHRIGASSKISFEDVLEEEVITLGIGSLALIPTDSADLGKNPGSLRLR